MTEPRWISLGALLHLHSASLSEFGGRVGIRDHASLNSAVARPRNRFAYEPNSDIATLAASYSFGLTRNHPFHDGNKRTSFHAAGLFCMLNGWRLKPRNPVEAMRKVTDLAAGILSEEEFAAWVRLNLEPSVSKGLESKP
ncbi:MAG: type II toxin-antitoxin system death-on-curing family toxin [Acidobacteriota bacterium]|nr:type II toxin-antitoxin system death-on-curing family toxin [Acidobacteriota bacterium]